MNDLLTNLFKGYATATDKTFVAYILRKKEEYEDGSNMTPDQLMQLADNKFKNLLQEGLWDAPSLEEEKIVALEAKVKQLTKAAKKKCPDYKNKKTDQKKKKPCRMFTKPNDKDLAKPRKWNGLEWWYCGKETGGKCDGQYHHHKPSECEGKVHTFKKRQHHEQRNANDDNQNKKLKITEAMQAMIDDSDSE